ncbi:MAG: dihydropteroate synthase [Myxococcus sp.]|nr:dihydropteroate synthase [Myxococcus sp.]
MILARRLFLTREVDREALALRSGRPAPPLGAQVVLLTGLGPEQAAALGGDADAAVVESVESLPPALREAVNPPPPPALALAGRRWAFDQRPTILGVVNVTPDSFSDGGRFATTELAVAHGLRLIDDGADWLDVGGESTRPNAAPVSLDEECARVLPVLEALRARAPSVPLSIDTSKAEVARRALQSGASLVNDVSAFADPAMAAVVAEARAAACLMHMQGTPRTMQVQPRYADVVQEVGDALEAAIARAVAGGVDRSRLLIDPGIGFGKALEHNLALLRHLEALRGLGVPVLLGTSRKSFLGALTGAREPEQRVLASAASVAIAAARGQADVFRVHDVKETRDALAVAAAIGASRGGATRW